MEHARSGETCGYVCRSILIIFTKPHEHRVLVDGV